jgi:hypothetical protein
MPQIAPGTPGSNVRNTLILIAHLLRTSGLRNQSFCLSKKVLRIGVRNHLFSSAQALRKPIAHFHGRGGVSMMRGADIPDVLQRWPGLGRRAAQSILTTGYYTH